MRRSYLLAGAGCLSVFTIGAGFALAQQGVDMPAGAVPGPAQPPAQTPDQTPIETREAIEAAAEAEARRRGGAGGRPAADDGPLEGGPVLTFGIASTLSATDNYSLRANNVESAELFDTTLSFGYLNRRQRDVLRFDLSGVVRAIEPPGPSSEIFDNQSASLDYDRRGVNANFSLGLNYDYDTVDSLDPFDEEGRFDDEPLDQSDLTLDQGERQQIGARFSLTTGLNNPAGFTLSGRYRDRSFSGTSDPDLFDSQIFGLTGTARLTISPVTETRIVLRYEDYSAEDDPNTDRRTTSVNLGLTQALSPVDTLDVSVGLQQIETDETLFGTRSTDTDDGVIGSLDFTRELPRGTIGTGLDLRDSVNGQSATWRVNRALPLPRGALELSLGVTSDVDDTIRPVGSVDFTHQMARSTLSASLERRVATSTESNEVQTTEASLGYDYQINALSSMAFTADFAEVDQIGGSGSDTTRTNLRAVYSRELTRDWRLSSGYEYRVLDESGEGSATANRVFLTLQREFAIRP